MGKTGGAGRAGRPASGAAIGYAGEGIPEEHRHLFEGTPREHQDLVAEFEIVDDLGYSAIGGEINGQYRIIDNDIRLDAITGNAQTARHELGHAVYYGAGIDRASYTTAWNEGFEWSTGHITDYASMNPTEGFAELYAFTTSPRVSERARAANASPAERAFVEAVIASA